MPDIIRRLTLPIRASARAVVFFLKLFPMLPSGPVDWVTRPPIVEKLIYPRRAGHAEGDVYRPPGKGPFPGMVVCLGVVPFGVDHPQVPVLGNALARAGFAALLYWSPAMRDFRLDPEDVESIALAYDCLLAQPYVDPARSGMLGTCVGGAFALMGAAQPLVCDRTTFLCAYAPFSSMWTFATDIASATRSTDSGREPWKVDQLTRKVFVHSVTASLEPEESQRLRDAFAAEGGQFDGLPLSPDGQSIHVLLTAPDAVAAEAALNHLAPAMRERLDCLSPINYLVDLRASLVIHLHDRGDQVIPVSESRRLHAALAGRPGVHYTEMNFSHLDPVKGRLPFFALVRELARFLRAIFPLFMHTTN